MLIVGRRFHGRVRKQNVFHGFALRAIRCDRVSTHEFTIIFGQNTPVLQVDPAIGIQLFDRDQFTVDQFPSIGALEVCFQLETVAFRQAHFCWPTDSEPIQMLERNFPDFLIRLDQQMRWRDF